MSIAPALPDGDGHERSWRVARCSSSSRPHRPCTARHRTIEPGSPRRVPPAMSDRGDCWPPSGRSACRTTPGPCDAHHAVTTVATDMITTDRSSSRLRGDSSVTGELIGRATVALPRRGAHRPCRARWPCLETPYEVQAQGRPRPLRHAAPVGAELKRGAWLPAAAAVARVREHIDAGPAALAHARAAHARPRLAHGTGTTRVPARPAVGRVGRCVGAQPAAERFSREAGAGAAVATLVTRACVAARAAVARVVERIDAVPVAREKPGSAHARPAMTGVTGAARRAARTAVLGIAGEVRAAPAAHRLVTPAGGRAGAVGRGYCPSRTRCRTRRSCWSRA